MSEPLTADRVSCQSDPYSVYGTEIPRIIPGSKEFWTTFDINPDLSLEFNIAAHPLQSSTL